MAEKKVMIVDLEIVTIFVLRAHWLSSIVHGSWQREYKIVSIFMTEIYQTFIAMKSEVTKRVYDAFLNFELKCFSSE